MKLIELHYEDGGGRLFVNVDRVIKLTDFDGITTIWFAGEDYVGVQESLDEVAVKIRMS